MNEYSSHNSPNDAAPEHNTAAGDQSSFNDEQLVAYLDGELDAENSRRIETQLASDPAMRRRLQSLERTWDLLDELDAAPVGDPFTRTTMEMVAVAADEDLRLSQAEMPVRRRRRRFQAIGAIAVAAAAGFFAIWLFTPDPNRRILENLPILEQFEEYRQCGSIAFLRQLRDEKLFTAKSPIPAVSGTSRLEDTASCRSRIESMKPEEKAELARIEERYVGLKPSEQKSMQRLHDDLKNAADGEELRAVMHAYCDWLKKLSPYTWFGLTEMSSSERFQWVKKTVRQEQSREAMFRLDAKDAEIVAVWLREYAAKHKDDFRKLLKPNEQKVFAQSDEERYRVAALRLLQAVNTGKLLPFMTNADLSELRNRLSAAACKQMEDKPALEQWRIVTRWPHFHPRRPIDIGPRPMLNIPDQALSERLADFFEKLNEDQRDRLLSMPSDEMYRKLTQMYQQSRPKTPDAAEPRPDGGRHDHHRSGETGRPAPKK